MSKKSETGIKGFDKLIGGGFPENKCILLTGSPGTGKTIFSLEYIYNGAAKYSERGLYVSFEEKAENLISQAKQFGWDFKDPKVKKLINIMDIPASELTQNTIEDMIRYIQKNKIKRIIIDSISALSINLPTTHTKLVEITPIYIKQFIYQFINKLQQIQDATKILITQSSEQGLSNDGVSEFICDGIIKINYESLGGNFNRTLTVRKMREVKNDEDIHPLEISSKGITVHNLE